MVVAMLAALGWTARAQACAGCRNPNMPITRLESVHLAPGEIRAAAVVGVTTLNVVHPAGCPDLASCNEVPVQPVYLHDQDIWPAELRPVLEVGLTRAFAAEVHLPLRLTRTTISYRSPDGSPYTPLDPDVHHRNETLAGIGDPWVLARWNTTLAAALLSVRAGVSLPLGRTEPDPFALGAEGKRHQHMQFGTGTFDPVLGLDASRLLGGFQLAAYAQGQASLYENRHGFRAGWRGLGGAQLAHRLVGGLTGGLGADVMYEGPERWDGEIQQDGNLGRTEILVGLSLVQALGATSLGLTARVPVWRHIIVGDEPPGTLRSPLMLSLVASRRFRGWN